MEDKRLVMPLDGVTELLDALAEACTTTRDRLQQKVNENSVSARNAWDKGKAAIHHIRMAGYADACQDLLTLIDTYKQQLEETKEKADGAGTT